MKRTERFYGWALFVLGALFYGYEYGLRVMPSLVMPEMIQHFHINHAGFGYLAASYYYAYVLFQIPAGILIDRYGAPRLMILACLSCALGTWVFSITHSFTVAMIARFFIGAGSVFAFVGTLSIASFYLPESLFALLAGAAAAVGTISAMMADISITHTLHVLGWQWTNQIIVAFGLLIVLAIFVCDRKNTLEHPEEMHMGYKELFQSSLLFLKDSRFWSNAAVGCLIYLPTTIFAELWGIPYLRMARGFTEHQAALGISCVFLGYTLGAPVAGFLSQYVSRQRLLFFGALSAAATMIAVLYLPDLSLRGVTVLLFALGFSYGAQSLIFAVAKDLVPVKLSGSVLAFTNMLVMLGGVFFQPVVGHIIDVLNHHAVSTQHTALYHYQMALSIVPIGVLVSALISFMQKKS